MKNMKAMKEIAATCRKRLRLHLFWINPAGAGRFLFQTATIIWEYGALLSKAAESSIRSEAMFKQLLWKEWRENLWKLGFGGAVSAAFVLLLFPDAVNCIYISFVLMLVVPVIYALDIFSGEMSNQTIHLLFKFPVPRWKIFFSKYLVSIGGMIAIFLAISCKRAVDGTAITGS
jgi:ABC-type transport system involved in multi-copper enzyme maturation permease subunit